MKITVTDNAVEVVSPYSPKFVAGAKQINGKWSKPAWVFPLDNEELVRDLCKKIYGTDGTPEEMVTLRVVLSKAEWMFDGPTFRLGPIEAIRKMGRDSLPRLASNCTIVQGSLKGSGGSRNNPRITFTDDCVMRVKDVPKSVSDSLIEKGPAAFSLIEDAADEKLRWTVDELAAISTLSAMSQDRLSALLREVSQ